MASFLVMPPKFEHMDSDRSANERIADRQAVHMAAELRLSVGQKFTVSVLDLSATGFRIETGNHIELGCRVFLAIPELNSLPAVIAWSKNPFYGCEFEKPLHPAVFEHFASKYPAITQ